MESPGSDTGASSAGHDGGSYTQGLKQEARREMHDAKDEMRREGRATMERQKHVVADRAGAAANALRRAGDQFNSDNQPYMADLADRFADNLERLASRLHERDLSSLTDEMQDFARRRPGTFIGGAVIGGFMLARFLKSSERHDRSLMSTARSAQTPGDSGHYRPHQESAPAGAEFEVASPETPAATEVQHHAQPH